MYDPEQHHRQSIRLKNRDYGSGLYFVTICVHRNTGRIFVGPAKDMVARVWESIPARFPGVGIVPVGAGLVSALPLKGTHKGCHENKEGTHKGCHENKEGTHKGCPYAVMPDHFHGILDIAGGAAELGDVVGAFKSIVANEYINGVRAGKWRAFPGKIWHRNYYERVVRDERDLSRIMEYIRMNPWRLVFELPDPVVALPRDRAAGLVPARAHKGGNVGAGLVSALYRGIGNAALWQMPKIGILCSGNCPAEKREEAMRRCSEWAAQQENPESAVISGFHSPVERDCLGILLKGSRPIILMPPCSIESLRIPGEWISAMERGGMLVVSGFEEPEFSRSRALERNRIVAMLADDLYVPYARPGGELFRLKTDKGG